MSIDLKLGFKNKPEDLEATLIKKKFKHVSSLVEEDGRTYALPPKISRQINDNEIRLKIYRLSPGIHFSYSKNIENDSNWPDIIKEHNLDVNIIAEGSLSVVGNDADYQRTLDIGRFLRDRYSTILYDPQTDQVIKD